MGLLDRLREGLEEALAEPVEAFRYDAGTPAPRAVPEAPERDARPPAGTRVRPEAGTGPAVRSAPAAPERKAPVARDRRHVLLSRLHDPGALREAFVIKEILDRPVGLRRMRDRKHA